MLFAVLKKKLSFNYFHNVWELEWLVFQQNIISMWKNCILAQLKSNGTVALILGLVSMGARWIRSLSLYFSLVCCIALGVLEMTNCFLERCQLLM